MSHVFVIDTNQQPLDPVHPGYARRLLKQGRAAVFRRFPFTIILKYAVAAPHVEPLRIKLDPGSRTTGIAILSDTTGATFTARGLSKAHWIDAACVGQCTPESLPLLVVCPLLITAQGHGCRQVTNVNRFGVPRGKAKQGGRIVGFKTGDRASRLNNWKKEF